MDIESILSQTIPEIRSVGLFIQQAKINASDVEVKDVNSLVTFVDKEAEKQLVHALLKILPNSGFITEEGTIATESHPWMWIIDPLDGTTNYIHGVPCYSISVALHYENDPIMGIVYELNKDEMYTAIKDKGARLNNRPIEVSSQSQLNNSLIATGFPYSKFDFMDWYVSIFKRLMMESRGIRRFGSAAVDLCYVAAGRFDGFFEKGLNVWDVAAGAIVLREAGGMISDFSGKNNFLYGGEILAANKDVHSEMLNLIQNI